MNGKQGMLRRSHNTIIGRLRISRRRTKVAERDHLRPDFLALEDRRLMATFHVTSTDDSGMGSLRAAIDQANQATEAVVIDFQLPTPTTLSLTSGQLELKNTKETVSIKGPGADVLTIDATKTSRVLQIDPNVIASITGLTLSNGSVGKYGEGGDLLNQGILTLTDVTVRGGYAYVGGALSNSGTATLLGCTISNDVANRGGGLFNAGTATLNDCFITGNKGVPGVSEYASLGGGVFSWGTLSMTGGTITGDSSTRASAVYVGGKTLLTGITIQGDTSPNEAIFDNGSPLTMVGCTISGNRLASNTGFGIDAFYYSGTVDLTDCTIEGFSNGGIVNDGSTVTMTDCRILNNSGQGGLYNHYSYSNATLTNCTISGNTTVGLKNLGNLLLTDSTISNNTGGGISNNGNATLTRCTISANTWTGQGGGLYNAKHATLTDCTISGNSDRGSAPSRSLQQFPGDSQTSWGFPVSDHLPGR